MPKLTTKQEAEYNELINQKIYGHVGAHGIPGTARQVKDALLSIVEPHDNHEVHEEEKEYIQDLSELLTEDSALAYGVTKDLFEPFSALVKKRIYDAIFDISNLTSEEIDKPLKPDNTQQQETLQNRIQEVRENQQQETLQNSIQQVRQNQQRRLQVQERASDAVRFFSRAWMVTLTLICIIIMVVLISSPPTSLLGILGIIAGISVSGVGIWAPMSKRGKKLLEGLISAFNDVNTTQAEDISQENVEVIIDEQTPLINAANQQRHSPPQDSSINQDSTSTVATNTQFTENRQHNFGLFASSSQSGEEQKTENLAKKCEPNEVENSAELDGAPTIAV